MKNLTTFSTWTPHRVLDIEVGPQRTAMIGRAFASIIDGVECIFLVKTDADAEALGKHLHGKFDTSEVYKATLIETVGIEVAIAPVPVDGVRGEDGAPVAQYAGVQTDAFNDAAPKTPDAPFEDPDEL